MVRNKEFQIKRIPVSLCQLMNFHNKILCENRTINTEKVVIEISDTLFFFSMLKSHLS